MNPKTNKPKLKAAFKRFQPLPSLLLETDPQHRRNRCAGQARALPDVMVLVTPAASELSVRPLAE
jgi:hypothetical protein